MSGIPSLSLANQDSGALIGPTFNQVFGAPAASPFRPRVDMSAALLIAAAVVAAALIFRGR